jgi:exodeoxyribonuclease VII small subunit
MTFEESMNSLEDVIKKLESETTSLEEMIKLYEKGIEFTRICKNHLKDAEQRVTTLVKDNNQFKELTK